MAENSDIRISQLKKERKFFLIKRNVCPKRQLKIYHRGKRKISRKYLVDDFDMGRRTGGKKRRKMLRESRKAHLRNSIRIRGLICIVNPHRLSSSCITHIQPQKHPGANYTVMFVISLHLLFWRRIEDWISILLIQQVS